MGDADKTRVRERRSMIRQPAGAQTGKHAERKVEPADKNTRREMHQSVWYAEIRDKPKPSRRKRRSNTAHNPIKLGLTKAVKKEMGDDQVVGASKRKSQRIGVMNAQAGLGVTSRRLRALAKQLEHSGARVDRVSPKVRIMHQQLGEKAAVPIA